MGLCNTDERDLHAKYRLVVQPPPPPEVSLRVECKVFEHPTRFDNPLFPVWRDWPFEIPITPMDATSNFTCSYTRTGEGTFELDFAFIADPENGLSIAQYVLIVTIGYDEPLLPFGLLTRNVNGTGVGDLCLLGYHFGRHPPPGTARSETPLGEFRSCDEAVSMTAILSALYWATTLMSSLCATIFCWRARGTRFGLLGASPVHFEA